MKTKTQKKLLLMSLLEIDSIALYEVSHGTAKDPKKPFILFIYFYLI